ncbi:hypothetical protein GYMLUDRAFT_584168 [Collybiopsis luxurians FD-317 M1]|uniref:Uncharacterized protein n=1 Tax=Collybiopsis luxurians FD-317 M1 TaxID=944289 RepID=A0A0D0CYN7_9AGAR|nr:hypothetical protein GYMLUDRAFT_584168 [Collybiopsis luxurians FD-317 M1]
MSVMKHAQPSFRLPEERSKTRPSLQPRVPPSLHGNFLENDELKDIKPLLTKRVVDVIELDSDNEDDDEGVKLVSTSASMASGVSQLQSQFQPTALSASKLSNLSPSTSEWGTRMSGVGSQSRPRFRPSSVPSSTSRSASGPTSFSHSQSTSTFSSSSPGSRVSDVRSSSNIKNYPSSSPSTSPFVNSHTSRSSQESLSSQSAPSPSSSPSECLQCPKFKVLVGDLRLKNSCKEDIIRDLKHQMQVAHADGASASTAASVAKMKRLSDQVEELKLKSRQAENDKRVMETQLEEEKTVIRRSLQEMKSREAEKKKALEEGNRCLKQENAGMLRRLQELADEKSRLEEEAFELRGKLEKSQLECGEEKAAMRERIKELSDSRRMREIY